MKSKQNKPKEPVVIKQVVKEVLDNVKILQENQPKEDVFSKINTINEEIRILWSNFTSDFNFKDLETQLSFTI